jgi:phospholipid-translocating ATPase
MALSYKDLSADEVAQFQEALVQARANQEGREAALAELYEGLEAGQTLLGCNGIEDSLQEGVPETIKILREAAIHVWMVTGDLMNTAIKIARSSRLIADDGQLFTLTIPKEGITA